MSSLAPGIRAVATRPLHLPRPHGLPVRVHRRVTALAFLPDGIGIARRPTRTGRVRTVVAPRSGDCSGPATMYPLLVSGRVPGWPVLVETRPPPPLTLRPMAHLCRARSTIWDLASRTPVLVDDFSDRPVNSPVPKPRSVVYSPDSTKLAASFDDDLIRVYDVSTLSRTPVATRCGVRRRRRPGVQPGAPAGRGRGRDRHRSQRGPRRSTPP